MKLVYLYLLLSYAFALSESSLFLSDIKRSASVPGASPASVFAQATALQFERKVERFTSAKESGLLGDVTVTTSLGPLTGI